MSEIMRALGRIEGKLDGVVASQVRLRGDHEAVEGRVRTLENWRWYIIGIAAAVGGLIATAFTFM